MFYKKKENRLWDATFLAVVKEMAKPHLVASVRAALTQTVASGMYGFRRLATHGCRKPKFHTGQLVYNRSTKEDGLVSRVFADDGIITYEVWVPQITDSWAPGHWISHWLGHLVQLSGNKHLGSPLTN